MASIQVGKFYIKEYQRINILFGKNGCGKSTTLKEITNTLQSEKRGLVEYITPERGGILTYQSGIEQNMQNQDWLLSSRKTNQFSQFKEQSVVVFKEFKAQINTQLEEFIVSSSSDESIKTTDLNDRLFVKYINKINSLLDNIEIRADKSAFKIYSKGTDTLVPPEAISSGESELISLAIECLAYEAKCEEGQDNFLLLDEPDVHIHPDLQVRLMHFLKELVSLKKFTIIIATHSTAMIGALENYEHIGFNFFIKGNTEIGFHVASKEYKSILPIFGAHPLSNIYCQTPIFLVEGDDDVWIWQQAIKTSGNLKLYPCSVDGQGNLLTYENKVNELILSVYDSEEAMGYSLRDKDDNPAEDIDTPISLSKVKRFMLSCRCSENLFLSDNVLQYLNSTWEETKSELQKWIENNSSHKKHNEMLKFKDSGFNRKNSPIKEIINIITGIIATKPWQVLVGQTIGSRIKDGTIGTEFDNQDSIDSYLGNNLVNFIKLSSTAILD